SRHVAYIADRARTPDAESAASARSGHAGARAHRAAASPPRRRIVKWRARSDTVPGSVSPMENAPNPPRPLDGILVVDFTRVLAGPFCTMLLADLGARVIKVERKPNGDPARGFGPFLDGRSLYFGFINRGKESIALDLKDDADRA